MSNTIFLRYTAAEGWQVEPQDYSKMTKKTLVSAITNMSKELQSMSDYRDRQEKIHVAEIKDLNQCIKELMTFIELVKCFNPVMSMSRGLVGLLRETSWNIWDNWSHIREKYSWLYYDKTKGGVPEDTREPVPF